MKKQIVSAIVLAGMIASSQAFASDAREMVMGTGGASAYSNGGSFYYEDGYNFFYNPAYVNDYKNWAIFEKGAGDHGATAGFVTSLMNWNLGVFFNRASDNSLLAHTAAAENVTDVMLGGDMGVKWGLGLTYGSGTANKAKDLTARVGIEMNGLDPFVRFKAIGKDETAAGDVKYKDLGFGARYHYGEWIPYAAYDMGKVDATAAAGTETKVNTLVVGLGREAKLTESARLVYALYWMNVKTDTAGTSDKTNIIPVDMAVEADTMSWMTLRGGFTHRLNSNGATTARVGGSFHLGKADVDYAFGNLVGGAAPTTPDSADVGFDSGTFHKVSLRYSW